MNVLMLNQHADVILSAARIDINKHISGEKSANGCWTSFISITGPIT